MKVIIDGENFRHQLAHVLVTNKKLTAKNSFFKFDLVGFFQEVLGQRDLEIIYCATRIRRPDYKIPVKLSTAITTISSANRKWVAQLTNQSIKVVKAGYLRVRESNVCVHCGKKTLVLQEKGVDVRVATELLHVGEQDPVVLASSDSDLIPALSVAKSNKTKIIYVCYAAQVNRSIAAYAQKVITFDDVAVLKYFKD